MGLKVVAQNTQQHSGRDTAVQTTERQQTAEQQSTRTQRTTGSSDALNTETSLRKSEALDRQEQLQQIGGTTTRVTKPHVITQESSGGGTEQKAYTHRGFLLTMEFTLLNPESLG